MRKSYTVVDSALTALTSRNGLFFVETNKNDKNSCYFIGFTVAFFTMLDVLRPGSTI